MSINSYLRVSKNLQGLKRRDCHVMVYDNQVTDWEDIFKIHPIANKKNAQFFYNLEQCKEYWGKDNDILIMRSAYAWSQMREIEKNAVEDVITFKEIAPHVLRHKHGELDAKINKFFQLYMTVMAVANKNMSPEENKWNELTSEKKEDVLRIAVQYYGLQAYQRIKELKLDVEVGHFNEKLLLWYWHGNASEINKSQEVLDELIKNKKVEEVWDKNYIIDKLNPNDLMNIKGLEVNKKYIPWSSLEVLMERYEIDSKTRVTTPMKSLNKDRIPLDEILNLLLTQTLIDSRCKNQNRADDPKYILFGQEYKSLQDIHQKFPLTQPWQHEAMKIMIERQKETYASNKSMTPFFDNLDREINSIQFKQEVEQSLPLKDNKARKIKV